jgi:FtsP/CotA-like multicopper oxidase with cupredoxin domain
MAVQSCAWQGSRRLLLRGSAAALASLAMGAAGGGTAAAEDWTLLRAQRDTRGPTLRVRRGQELRVRLINEMDEPAALHWHGVRLPNAMDGVPGLTQEPVKPGASFDYRFTPPDAGTFWYRPAVTSAGQRLGGPLGVLIVDENEAVVADRDEVLLLADPPEAGAQAVDIAVRTNERLRLRLLNAGRRILPLNLSPHRAVVMAIDGQPADPFAARDGRLVLGPGNRIDVFLDATRDPGSAVPVVVESPQGSVIAARLVYDTGAPLRAAPLPDPMPLPVNALPERIDLRNALRAELRLAPATTMRSRLFAAKRGRPVVVTLANPNPVPYAVHVHGHHFRLLDALDDGWKPFWLDTVPVGVQSTSRVAFVADNPGKWLVEAEGTGESNPVQTTWFEIA